LPLKYKMVSSLGSDEQGEFKAAKLVRIGLRLT